MVVHVMRLHWAKETGAAKEPGQLRLSLWDFSNPTKEAMEAAFGNGRQRRLNPKIRIEE